MSLWLGGLVGKYFLSSLISSLHLEELLIAVYISAVI